MISLIESVVKTVGKVIPDKDKQKEIELELTKAVNSGEIELEKIKLQGEQLKETSRIELIQKMPVPGILYTFLLVIINNSILAPYIELIFKVQVPILPIDENLYNLVGWLFTGVISKKTIEKFSK